MRKTLLEIFEGFAGYSAFIPAGHLEPNDVVRQQTQARSGEFPYDQPVSYGTSVGSSIDGVSYQMKGPTHPPIPQQTDPSDIEARTPWDIASEGTCLSFDLYQPGPQAPDSFRLGYGDRGLMGDGLTSAELELDYLRNDFRNSFVASLPILRHMDRHDLFSLLNEPDPEYSETVFCPDDGSEVFDIYNSSGRHVYAPGAEDDPEEL